MAPNCLNLFIYDISSNEEIREMKNRLVAVRRIEKVRVGGKIGMGQH